MNSEAMVWTVGFESQEQAEKFNKFSEELNKDADTLAALDNSSTMEEFFAACKKYISCTFEEFQKVCNSLSEKMKAAYEETFGPRELNDDELDFVVGGSWKSFWKKVGKIALCAVAVVGAVAACAATGGLAGAAIGAGLAVTAGATSLGAVGMAAAGCAAIGAVAGAGVGIKGMVDGAKK